MQKQKAEEYERKVQEAAKEVVRDAALTEEERAAKQQTALERRCVSQPVVTLQPVQRSSYALVICGARSMRDTLLEEASRPVVEAASTFDMGNELQWNSSEVNLGSDSEGSDDDDKITLPKSVAGCGRWL